MGIVMGVRQRASGKWEAYHHVQIGTFATKEEALAAVEDYRNAPKRSGVRTVVYKPEGRLRRAIKVLLGRA
jgi:ribulose bisphosphate carboxylase small subunit